MFLEFFLCGVAPNEGTKHCAIFRGNFPHEGKALNIQNLPYFWNMKTHVGFFTFHFVLGYFSLMNALVYIDIDQGIH